MRIAVKRLSVSDLSFFKAQVERVGQKAFELCGDVFVKQFYPGLRGSFDQVNLPLVVIGPGGRSVHRVTRRVVRLPLSESWRIDGEIIADPEGEPGRYAMLSIDDFAIIGFEGSVRPSAITLVLVSIRSDPELQAIIEERVGFGARSAMVHVQGALIDEMRVMTKGAYLGEHPLDRFCLQDTVEEVLFGEAAFVPARRRLSGRATEMSQEDLRRQFLAADETRQRGEELFWTWLTATDHCEDDFEWVAQPDARAPFDYEVRSARWIGGRPIVLVSVKATRGLFERHIHMSIGELRFAAATDNYRIARLYEIDGRPGRLRVLTGVSRFAAQVLAGLGTVPDGVVAESVQIDPRVFSVELDSELP
ncbi:MAG TPA: hypothetical protein VE153_28345 [Myxococcus sp.]|nr:hypothetical protein [Myxococcus sp.]